MASDEAHPNQHAAASTSLSEESNEGVGYLQQRGCQSLGCQSVGGGLDATSYALAALGNPTELEVQVDVAKLSVIVAPTCSSIAAAIQWISIDSPMS